MRAVRQPEPPVGNSPTCPKYDKPMRVVRATPTTMLKALNRAERYRDMAEECRRLAAVSLSAQMRNRYSRMANDYVLLVDVEEQVLTHLYCNLTLRELRPNGWRHALAVCR
jgi:hypothetical protein